MPFVEFEQVNRRLGPPEGLTEDQVATLPVWTGEMDGIPRTIAKFQPVRGHIEALAQGAAIWLHMLGQRIPPVDINTADPFKPVADMPPQLSDHRIVSAEDPHEIGEKCASFERIHDLVCPENPTAAPEVVVERVMRIVHAYVQLQKTRGN